MSPLILIVFLIAPFALGDSVVKLTEKNFESELRKYPLALVKFYAPWCGHCKKLAPEFSKAAEKLISIGSSAFLAEVDCTTEESLCTKFSISGYPTLKIFKNGEYNTDYNGGRTEADIVNFMDSRSKPASKIITKLSEVENSLHDDKPTMLAYFKSESDSFLPDYMKLASDMIDDFVFAHTHDNIFGVGDSKMIKMYLPKRVALKSDVASVYTGSDKVEELKKWMLSNCHGKIGYRTPSNKHLFPSTDILVIYHNISYDDYASGFRYFRNRVLKALANVHLGDLKVAYSYSGDFMMELSDFGAEYATPLPLATIRSSGKKYKQEGISFTELSDFIKAFHANTLSAYVKTEPLPTEQETVKKVVALNFDEIVNDASKDVFIMFHAPWCGHCKNLMPKFKEAAEKLKDEPGLTLAIMDATANEIPQPYEVHGFPTLYFVPKGNKSSPKKFDGKREVDDLIKYVAHESTDELIGFDRTGTPKKAEL